MGTGVDVLILVGKTERRPVPFPVQVSVEYPLRVPLPGTGYGANEEGKALIEAPEPAVTVTVTVAEWVIVTADKHAPLGLGSTLLADSLGAELGVGKEPYPSPGVPTRFGAATLLVAADSIGCGP